MNNEDTVVVSVRVERLFHTEKSVYATRMRELGLTAYGNSPEESFKKVKQMFAVLVKAHRKRGTLEKRLKESGLDWCWASEYNGELPVDWISPEGQILTCYKTQKQTWQPIRELAVA